MIDAERMLGSLVRGAMSGRSRGRRGRRGGAIRGLSKGALGMGALGIAFAAFEHLSQKRSGTGPIASPAGATDAPPSLPPLPGSTAASPPLPPLPGATAPDGDALLLVRAMIAAANADHRLDDEERSRILGALDESGLGSEERDFLLAEIETPIGLESLAQKAGTPEKARQVYLASLMAIEVDTEAERNYLARLAERLGLDESQVAELEKTLE